MTATPPELGGSSAEQIEAMATGLVPPAMALKCQAMDEPGFIFAEENAALRRAAPKRKSEFVAGRMAARAALWRLGGPFCAIPKGSDGAPIWPDGFVGSISHCRSMALVVVARRADFAGQVGIDIEEAEPLDRDLWESVCTSHELAWLTDQTEPGMAAKAIFSIKEAVYKAQFGLTRRMLDFQDLGVEIDMNNGSFIARTIEKAAKAYPGRFAANRDFLVAFATA